MAINDQSNSLKRKNYILNEVGLQIARENIARQMRELLEYKQHENFKEEIIRLVKDRDEINKGNMEIIKKYIGGLKFE